MPRRFSLRLNRLAVDRGMDDLLGWGHLAVGQLGKEDLVQVHQQPLAVKTAYVLSGGDGLISVVVVAAVGLQVAELEALVGGLIDGDQVDVVGCERQQEEKEQSKGTDQEHAARVLHEQVLHGNKSRFIYFKD